VIDAGPLRRDRRPKAWSIGARFPAGARGLVPGPRRSVPLLPRRVGWIDQTMIPWRPAMPATHSGRSTPTKYHASVRLPLGEGAMGAVYEAENTRIRRRVAIKILPPTVLPEGRHALRRFEAQRRRPRRADRIAAHRQRCSEPRRGSPTARAFMVLQKFTSAAPRSIQPGSKSRADASLRATHDRRPAPGKASARGAQGGDHSWRAQEPANILCRS
jgi:hypothetical protein